MVRLSDDCGMEPEFGAGDFVYVDPDEPAMAGGFVAGAAAERPRPQMSRGETGDALNSIVDYWRVMADPESTVQCTGVFGHTRNCFCGTVELTGSVEAPVEDSQAASWRHSAKATAPPSGAWP